MKKSGVVLGLILVIVGFIILLKSFGILAFSWWTIWKIWPFAFIFIGIAILPIKKTWKGLFYIISVVGCMATMMYFSKYNEYNTLKDRIRNFIDRQNLTELKEDIMQFDQISYFGFSDSISHVRVDAEFASGEYLFETKPYKKMLRLSFKGTNYSSSITEEGTFGVLFLRPKQWDKHTSSGKINLYEDFNYTFCLQGEKSDVSLNANNLRIDTLIINANEASTWHITLSKLTPETHIFIKAHPDAGNIELTIPASSGYRFTTTVLSEDTQWNNLQPVEPGSYQSDNFMEANSRVFIEANSLGVNMRHE
ncbi:MAG: DUF5668 domain-containing protein [Bacteroidales bacterium]|nr:DUF5668 domain-containing protein [Bacteroidales bacterium]